MESVGGQEGGQKGEKGSQERQQDGQKGEEGGQRRDNIEVKRGRRRLG